MAILNPGDNGPCEHYNFYSGVKVARITDEQEIEVIGFCAEIQIRCIDCGQAFEFTGLPCGSHPVKPMVSFDATELRAPIKPSKYKAEIKNRNLVEN